MSIRQSNKFEYTSNCQKCGREFTQITTQSEINRNKHRKCCCLACAKSRNHSDKTKLRISKGLNSHHESLGTSRKSDNPEHRKNCSKGSVRSNGNRTKEIRKHECVYCGKTIYAKFYRGVYCYDCAEERGLDNLQMYDENGKSIPSKKRIRASKKVQQRLLDNGTHQGWQSRNIISYPEKFWKKVLENNGIQYSFNHVVKKSELGVENDNSNYFLDFLIDDNIDLEIDGKQHKYADRAESDKVRDELLSKNGYLVYRVEWNEINTEVGKQRMKEKIDEFLNFMKNKNQK